MPKPRYGTIHPQAGPFAATGNGVPFAVQGMDIPVGVLVSGTFVATIKIEVSNDGVNWAQFGADVTAPGTVKVDIPVKQVRARCSAFTSGTARVDIGALNSSTDDE